MIIVQTPLRISFLGGGTDFEDFYSQHGGAVLSSAIDKCVFVIVKERFDDDICLNYSRREIVQKVDDIHHDLIREALRATGIDKGVEVTTLADIPSTGTGLGSSSSITVALLQALYAFRGVIKNADELAHKACEIEINNLGRPIGKQDQYIAAHGNFRHITFTAGSVNVEEVKISREARKKLNDSLMLFYMGYARQGADILQEQQRNIPMHIESLKKLRDLSHAALAVVKNGRMDDFGDLLHEGWELKKGFASKIADDGINDVYKVARAAGAIGGKITGAGGGGFLLLYCPPGRQEEVRSAVKLREMPFHFQEDGSKVIFNYRRSS
jgi:D-glycero-alpha-D-manno-heptose-7-phosphate kinase